jgi:predicted nucleotidyltransferase
MTNQAFKLISVNLVGSRLYGLDSKNSDYDYTVLYRREPKQYICFGEYKDFMDETKLVGSRETNYKYLDIKKFLQLAGKSSFGALELLYCNVYFSVTDALEKSYDSMVPLYLEFLSAVGK